MTPFTRVDGVMAPLDRSNVDTDAIVPKQFMKSITRAGLGPHLFDGWRYDDHGELGRDCTKRPLKADFVLNLPEYAEATVLLARANFGCGSSREHAPWALMDYGIRVVIATSFADIFSVNCIKNGLLTVTLRDAEVETLFVTAQRNAHVAVDLVSQTVQTAHHIFRFDIEPFIKKCLLNGADEVALTLRHAEEITDYEERRRQEEPWLFRMPAES
ncbi:3-isopropylmalate dehydratase small subunit [Paraburkholderia sp. RL18-085-BIA-A]|uniref:3-isopropylmalate dehydratase small subunit n=1 Tax=Paraburkholderia sp. RL18-085-BIA-A TaxID=3031633 RepID=UPI0038BCE471